MFGSTSTYEDPTANQQVANYGALQRQNAEAQYKRFIGNPHETQLARIGQTPARLQQKRFGKVFPWLQSQITDWSGKFGNTAPGGQSGMGPTISGKGMDIGLQRSMINDERAQNTMQMQSRLNEARQKAAVGSGVNSGMFGGLKTRLGQAVDAANARVGTSVRENAAKFNIPFGLEAQKAQEAQYANRMNEDIERRRQILGFIPSMFSSIGGLV